MVLTRAVSAVACYPSLVTYGVFLWFPTILRDRTGAYSGGLLVPAGALVIEAVLVMSLRQPRGSAT